jgi:hypothetical protein
MRNLQQFCIGPTTVYANLQNFSINAEEISFPNKVRSTVLPLRSDEQFLWMHARVIVSPNRATTGGVIPLILSAFDYKNRLCTSFF